MAVAAAPRAPARPRPEPATAVAAILPRLVAFLGLAMLGLLTWSDMLAPAPHGRAVLTALAATVCAAGLAGAGAIAGRRRRNAVLLGITVALLVIALLGAELPARLLVPSNWDELVRSVAEGLSALPGTLVPYGGADVLVRRTLLLGGTALTAIAVLQGFWPREAGRPPGSAVAAMITLGTLYAVPVISRSPEHPFLSGAIFTLLLCAFLFADRLSGARVLPAALLVGVITIAAAAAAPALDRPGPWVNYESFAEDVAGNGTVGYQWNHGYGPIDWPRDGRELLRVKAQAQAYWKAEALDTFDGRVWRRTGSVAALEPDGDRDQTQPQWFQTITVRVRGLRSSQFITAGSASRVFDAPRQPINAGAGTFETQRGILRRGAEYKASVYTPRPTASQLENAVLADQASLARQWLRVDLPEPGIPLTGAGEGEAWAEASFPPYGSGGATLIQRPTSSIRTTDGAQVVRSTALGRIYDLSQRLLAGSDSAYDYVRRVRERVQQGALYTERPKVHQNPLDAFLFEDRVGYCQHFSGAMALLLRMGGVPARVAVGFSPGSLDRSTGEYVVRDFDAHSWVEAYFPRYGWVTFDPTPAASPAREQTADQAAALSSRRSGNPGGDRPSDPGFGGPSGRDAASAGGGGGALPTALLVLAVLAAVLLVVGVIVWWRRPKAGDVGDPELAELERALRRSGRPLPPDATLGALERRLGATAEARGYLRALSARRYGFGGPSPTRAQRAALRRELAAGLGRAGRLRAWWALPPRAS